jgi:adenosine deaminase
MDTYVWYIPSPKEEAKHHVIDPHLPFIDLHRHLDGNVRLETILDIGRINNLPLPAWSLEELRPFVQLTEAQPGVMAFINRMKWMMAVMVDYSACRRVACENVEDAKIEGIDYLELRFSPWFMSESHNLDPVGVVEAVCDGISAGQQDFGIRVNLIGIISRTYGTKRGWEELNALLTQRDKITALDLAGDEANFPGELFNEHFRKGREVGWSITVHAGEIDGPHSIWQAIKGLGAERIGHAVTAIQDPALLDFMVEHRIGVESNLTSNVQTTTVSDYAKHPIKEFLKRGILVTLNTDDPGVSGIDLKYEYDQAAPRAGLSDDQIRKLQSNALDIAFLSSEEKEALRARKSVR